MAFVDCLSRMRGNSHVRFLGEGVAARPPPYPTHEEGSTPFTRSSDALSVCFGGGCVGETLLPT
jgi:hypothetical protein